MMSDSSVSVATFAAAFAALYAAHQVGDHWVQTQHQADTKGRPGWAGRIACATHVSTYTAVATVALVVAHLAAGVPLSFGRVFAGLAISAVSHYAVDRRVALCRVAGWLGKSPAWLDHGGGMYALDQSWHVGWLFVAALVIA